MLDSLIAFDKSLLLYCNGFHVPWLDAFFWFVSARLSNLWVVLLLLLLLFFRTSWKEALLVIAGVALTVLICDQFASSLCKPLFHRLRPTHDEEIGSLVTLVNNYRGGRYGFISSHAANAFGAAVFLIAVFRNRFFSVAILLWAVVVSYSRIYLGVHYPGDILAGTIAGILVGLAVYQAYKWTRCRLQAAVKFPDGEVPYRGSIYVNIFAGYICLLLVGMAMGSYLLV